MDRKSGMAAQDAEGGPFEADVFRSARRPEPLADLTARQTEVLGYVAMGFANTEIAAILNCAPGTVKNHVASILLRLQVSNRTEAAGEWIRRRARQPISSQPVTDRGHMPFGT